MFHSAGYFRGIVCPFFEHGLCHRPYCHYRHGKRRSKTTVKKLPQLHSRLKQPAKPDKNESPSTKSDASEGKISRSDTAEAKHEVSAAPVPANEKTALYGSSKEEEEDASTSKTSEMAGAVKDASGEEAMTTTPASDIIPSYAPEKCIIAEARYHSPEKEASQAKAGSVNITESEKTGGEKESSTPQHVITEYEVFGSSDSDDGGGGNEILECGEQLPTEEELVRIEAEFRKVTAAPVEPAARKPSKRKSSDPNSSEGGLKKRRLAHSTTPVFREQVKVQPSKTVSNFSGAVDADSLYLGKKRVVKPRVQSSMLKRPKLALTPNAKIPTNLRQKYLDCYIDEFMKMNVKPEEAYEKALAEEKQLFDRSSRKMIYLNLSTLVLKKLRAESAQHVKERRQRSDARVEAVRQGEITAGNTVLQSPTNSDSCVVLKSPDPKVPAKKKKTKSADGSKRTAGKSLSGVGRSWQSLEAELQASFSTGGEAKTSSAPVIQPSSFYTGKKPETHKHKSSSEIKKTKIDQPSPKRSDSTSEAKLTKERTDNLPSKEEDKIMKTTNLLPEAIEMDHEETTPTFLTTNDPHAINLATDLFGMSSEDSDTNVPSRQTSHEACSSSDDQHPEGMSFESALTTFDLASKDKKGKKRLSRGKERAGSESTMKQAKLKKNTKPKKLKRKIPIDVPSPITLSPTLPASVVTDKKHSAIECSPVPCSSPLLGIMKIPQLNLVRTISSPTTAPKPPVKEDTKPISSQSPMGEVGRLALASDDEEIEVDIQSSVEEILTSSNPPKEEKITPTSPPLAAAKTPVALFQPSGPFINLTKVAAEQSKIRLMAAVRLGKLPLSKPRPKAPRKAVSTTVKPAPANYTIFKKKEITLTVPLFCKVMRKYLLSEEQLLANGYPLSTGQPGEAAINREGSSPPNIHAVGPNAVRHHCCRCSKPFIIYNSGQYQTVEKCVYHFGRLFKSREYGEGVVSVYTCCQQRRDSAGCQVAKLHVTSGDRPTLDTGYVATRPPPVTSHSSPSPPSHPSHSSQPSPSTTAVYGLDCEMCYTTVGLQLTRVSVIDMSLKPVLEAMVKPSHPIVDYNTRFSGLTAEDFAGVETTLEDIQQRLLKLFHSDTILLGHSLESDLRSLKLIHCSVVDTAIVFPHKKGPPYKRALKSLMAEFLQKFIQDSIDGGHDSLEDAKSCMELMLWRAKADLAKSSRRVSADT